MALRGQSPTASIELSDLTNPTDARMTVTMSASRILPKGRLERVAKLAKMGAGAGFGLVTGKSTEALAEQAALTLSSLRGLAAKVGQMASSVEGLLPEAMEAPFMAALSQLRDQTQNSAFADIASVIETELGAKLSDLFTEFDVKALASASIGQVHRGILPDGREVAVKVQHPGIEQAIGNDLANVRLIERLVGSLAPKGLNPDEVFDEVATRLREELDYRLEANHQRYFAQLHRADPLVVIPEVVESHSARRVMTSTLFKGRKFDDVLRDATVLERQGYASTLWRFVFRSILIGGRFNADPHPGNYLFERAPTVGFLDFGCVQRLSSKRRLCACAVHRAALERDEVAFNHAVCQLLETKGGPIEAFFLAFTRKAFEPLFASPFRITSSYLRGLVAFASDAKVGLLRERKKASAFPPELALMNRLQFGFYSLLSKLDVTVDFAAIELELLASQL